MTREGFGLILWIEKQVGKNSRNYGYKKRYQQRYRSTKNNHFGSRKKPYKMHNRNQNKKNT